MVLFHSTMDLCHLVLFFAVALLPTAFCHLSPRCAHHLFFPMFLYNATRLYFIHSTKAFSD